ncbi:MADS-box transcription factor 47-like [Primulina eburnea]|uniref:MADS-box transcription factor 47-like n=1 Tax=Primulina eburnea TaxID=1245227 RepID=UPI003C6C438D
MGREKMKMKKIEDISARQISFSKRRQGLFKKARELSTLRDAEVAAIVVSPAGKLHNYASSEIEDILCKFSMQSDKEQHSPDFQRENNNGVEHLNSGIDEKMKRLRLIMSMYLHQWGIEELQQLEMMLEAILKRVTARKIETVCKDLPTSLQTKEFEKMSTRTQSSEFRQCCDQEISGPISNMMNLEGAYFLYSQRINNTPTAQSGVRNYPEKWFPPPTDVYKANFAGANFQEMNGSGTGVVIRNWRGAFMAAQARFLPEQMDEIAASSMAAKSAVEFAAEYCFTHIVLEGDSHDTINILECSDENNPPETTCTLQEAKSYAKQLDRCSFSHVQRSGNTAAHMVAQYAINVKDEAVWLIEEPEYLNDILLADGIHLNS